MFLAGIDAVPATAVDLASRGFYDLEEYGGNVMLVEDEKLVRHATEQILSKHGYQVISAATVCRSPSLSW